MVEEEYREIVNLGPVKLYKKDLLELETFLTRLFPNAAIVFEIRLVLESLIMKSNSVESLLNNNIPLRTNELHLSVTGTRDGIEVDRGITFIFSSNYISYQIHSKDSVWFSGANKLIKEFFNARKPWYWWAKKEMFYVLEGAIAVLGGVVAGSVLTSAIRGSDTPRYITSLSLCVLLGLFVFATFSNRILPYTFICFEDKPKFDYKLATFTVAIITLLLTLVGSIIIPFLR